MGPDALKSSSGWEGPPGAAFVVGTEFPLKSRMTLWLRRSELTSPGDAERLRSAAWLLLVPTQMVTLLI